MSILIPALSSRPWQTVYNELQRQAAAFGQNVEILINVDDGQQTSGVKRQELLRQARGDYVAFADDDDRYSGVYVEAIMAACQTNVDVVTFDLQFEPAGVKRSRKIAKTERWRFGLNGDDRRHGQMTANHLCAWKRSIAQRVSWYPELGYGDDQLWYQPLLASGIVSTEQHIDSVLYYYLYNAETTANQRQDRIDFSRRFAGEGLGCFWHGAEIVVEQGGLFRFQDGHVRIRNRFGTKLTVPRDELECYHVMRVT